jgi:hypothetical protein
MSGRPEGSARQCDACAGLRPKNNCHACLNLARSEQGQAEPDQVDTCAVGGQRADQLTPRCTREGVAIPCLLEKAVRRQGIEFGSRAASSLAVRLSHIGCLGAAPRRIHYVKEYIAFSKWSRILDPGEHTSCVMRV